MVGRGFQPLLPNRFFLMTHRLRQEIIERYFGRRAKNVRQADSRFFHWIWKNKPHICEECGKPLTIYSATYISHILSRGAYPEMANDPRNVNILCAEHHNKWHTHKRQEMRVYEANRQIVEELKKDYNKENIEL